MSESESSPKPGQTGIEYTVEGDKAQSPPAPVDLHALRTARHKLVDAYYGPDNTVALTREEAAP